ncbi:MAG: LUD domain-containing protein [candidate division KSB1 bacterium]|nr:LUD domain-containing protein [candidate division KSB1 bacterium]
MSSRDKILHRIRTARSIASDLAPERQVEETLETAIQQDIPDSADALKQQFASALQSVSARFESSADIEHLYGLIDCTLRHGKDTRFAITGTDFTREIAEHVCSRYPDYASVSARDIESFERVKQLESIGISIVDCAYAIADTGTLCVPFSNVQTQLPFILPETVIAVVKEQQLAVNHRQVFASLSEKERRNMILITGASRTADIEKILFLGAHGPGELIVFLLEDIH